jgi:hypothetical protein
MTSADLIEACDILIKLEQEFATEEAKLSEISNEHAIKIDELDQQITTFRRNEDVDFRVFSPRNISTGNSEKIKVLENEKKMLEREKRDADKQLHYYSGKTDMIGRVLEILRGDLKEDSDEDSMAVRISRDPFAFIEEDSKDEVIEDKVDAVTSLFREANEKIKKSFDEFKEDEEIEDSDEDTDTISSEDMEDKEDQEDKIPETLSAVIKENESGGVPIDEVERVCHKVEFCGNIINNDRVRARLEIKSIVADLKDLIRAYGRSGR